MPRCFEGTCFAYLPGNIVFSKEVCNGGVACSLLKLGADKPRPLLQNSLVAIPSICNQRSLHEPRMKRALLFSHSVTRSCHERRHHSYLDNAERWCYFADSRLSFLFLTSIKNSQGSNILLIIQGYKIFVGLKRHIIHFFS